MNIENQYKVIENKFGQDILKKQKLFCLIIFKHKQQNFEYQKLIQQKRIYPEFNVGQQKQGFPINKITLSYNPVIQEALRQRQPNQNPKDYMLWYYTSLIHVIDITSTSIDPIAKYLCCWTNIISQAEIIAIQERTKQRHPNLICFLFFQDVGDKYAQSKEFKIYYEYLALDVKQLIEKRQQNKDYVPEDEICKMISGLSDSLLFLQNKGISNSALTLEVQDVSPFRAKAPNLFYNQFQPPENGKNQKFNRFKYDVFGLGMIILSLALLKDCEELYNQGILQVDKLEENLLRIGKLYPGRVENVLRLMVDLDNVKRPDWIEFQQILKQNKEKQIRLLEQQSNISQLKTIRLDYQNSSSLILISKQVIRNVKQVPMLIIIIKKIQKQRIIVRREMVQIKNQLI